MSPNDFLSLEDLKTWFRSLDKENKKAHGKAFNERVSELAAVVPKVDDPAPEDPSICPSCSNIVVKFRGVYPVFVQVACDCCEFAGPKDWTRHGAVRKWNKVARRLNPCPTPSTPAT